jgi:hypothetical protein
MRLEDGGKPMYLGLGKVIKLEEPAELRVCQRLFRQPRRSNSWTTLIKPRCFRYRAKMACG